MTEMDPHQTIDASTPRVGEIGRAVARNIRGLAETIGAPSFASSLADAARAQGDALVAVDARPTITTIRPEGRSLGTPSVPAAQAGISPVTQAGISPVTQAGAAPASVTPVTPAGALPVAQATASPSGVLPVTQSGVLPVAWPPGQAAMPMPTASMPTTQSAAPMASYPAASYPMVPGSVAVPMPNAALPGTPVPGTPVPGTPVPGTPVRIASAAGTVADPVVLPYGSSPAEYAAVSAAAEVRPLELKEYPKPSKSDRTGVLSWASSTPPEGRDLDRFIDEVRSRKVGWVTFEVDPAAVLDYDELIERLTDAGVQPIVRIQDQYGDLPPSEIEAMVTDLRGQGVQYFQLFDDANVASRTPDGRVDVREYADRWLTAAEAVIAGGGLPGFGALSPGGEYDDLGYMRQLLSVAKERGGTEALAQSWLALRGETPGASASTADTEGLARRAEWYDRVSRHALGRSMPILATLDPAGGVERLAADPVSTTPTPFAEQSEQALRDLRRKLPALFGVSRGTVESSRR